MEETSLQVVYDEAFPPEGPDFDRVMRLANLTAIDKAWWEQRKTFGDVIALCHSELSEGLEDFRAGHDLNEIYYEDAKPCGIPVEFADVLIRIFDYCQHYKIPLKAALIQKMGYNMLRERRHGGKAL